MVPAYCTMYEYKQPIVPWDITSMSNAWYLITVLNINTITTFISEISQQALKIYEKNGHNFSNLAEIRIIFYTHEQPSVSDIGTQYE